MIGMKDQCFGVEVEMTGLTRGQAAQALANYFGTEPYYVGGGYDKWSVKDPDGKVWSIMSDSSIVTEMKTESGYMHTSNIEYRVEMVTPKLTYAELPGHLRRLRRHLGWQQYRTAMAGLVGKQAVHDAVCEWESRKFRPALQLPDQSVARRTRTGDSPQRPAPDAGTAL